MADIPKYPGVHILERPSGVRTIAGTSTSITGFVGLAPDGPIDKSVVIRSITEFDDAFGGITYTSELGYMVHAYFRNGGSRAVVSRVADRANNDDYATAIDLLTPRRPVNLLCIAPATRGGDVATGVWEKAIEWCESERAVCLVDPPSSWSRADLAAAKTGLDGITNSHAAFYYPKIHVDDPRRAGRPISIGPSGAVAGVIARNDAARGVWKAPAGIDAGLVGVRNFADALDDSDIEVLNPQGINALRQLPSYGPVVWGARTAAGADARADQWKYLSVRRLALYIEESLVQGLQWVVFEPNDVQLWAQIRLNVGAFMHDLFRQGAFQGSRAADAYFVKCDEETTQPSDVNRGIVNVVVGFAPLKPAEFVVLQFQQILRTA